MKKLILLSMLMMVIAGLHGQEMMFELIKDINPDGDASPSDMCMYNGKVYFSANDGVSGKELWVTDGTEEGTALVKDINPGEGSSSPTRYAVAGGKLYFTANDGTNGAELWATDGTTEGTYLVKDINPNANGGSNPFYPVEYNGYLIFRAANGTEGDELWRSDGTEEGTYMIKDIREGSSGSNPAEMILFNGKVYFYAIDNTYGGEIWYTDGTEEGTLMLKDINPDGWSRASGLCVCNDKLFFAAEATGYGAELWMSDGTEAGTYMVKDINEGTAGSSPSSLKVIGNKVYFTAYTVAHNRELWRSDGTEEGTVLVKDLYEGATQGAFIQFDMCGYNGKVVFTGNEPEYGPETWITDGTEEGTVLLKDIYPGTGGSLTQGFKPLYYVHNDMLYFRAMDDSGSSAQLFISDGTEEGTYVLSPDRDYHSMALNYASGFITLGNVLIFTGNYYETGQELWKVVEVCEAVEEVEVSEITLSEATISWTHEGVGFNIQYRKAADEDWISTSVETTEITLENLEDGTQYEYQIQAVCSEYAGDVSLWTNIATFNTLAITCFPPENINVAATHKTFTVTWEGEADKYELDYRLTSATDWTTVEVSGTSHTVANIQADTDYSLRMRSLCSDTDISDWSATIEFKTGAITCFPPENINVAATHKTFTVTWEGEADKYELDYRLTSATDWTTVEVSGTSHTVANIQADTDYSLRMRSLCGDTDISDWSATIEFKTEAEPECVIPYNLQVTDITINSVLCSWDADASNLNWDLRYRVSSTNVWFAYGGLPEKTFTIENLNPNTAYLWTVRANCEDGLQTAWANEGSFTTDAVNISQIDVNSLQIFMSGSVINIINPDRIWIDHIQLITPQGAILNDFAVDSADNVLIPTLLKGTQVIIIKVIGSNFSHTKKVLVK